MLLEEFRLRLTLKLSRGAHNHSTTQFFMKAILAVRSNDLLVRFNLRHVVAEADVYVTSTKSLCSTVFPAIIFPLESIAKQFTTTFLMSETVIRTP